MKYICSICSFVKSYFGIMLIKAGSQYSYLDLTQKSFCDPFDHKYNITYTLEVLVNHCHSYLHYIWNNQQLVHNIQYITTMMSPCCVIPRNKVKLVFFSKKKPNYLFKLSSQMCHTGSFYMYI